MGETSLLRVQPKAKVTSHNLRYAFCICTPSESFHRNTGRSPRLIRSGRFPYHKVYLIDYKFLLRQEEAFLLLLASKLSSYARKEALFFGAFHVRYFVYF